MKKNSDIHELADGDVRVWINEGGAISLKAVDSHGDPIELSEDEAMEISLVLQKLVAKLRD